MADFPLGLSFDDVLLLPRLSAILPGDADISSQLVPGFDMKNSRVVRGHGYRF